MINVEYTSAELDHMLISREADVIAVGMNCFHHMLGINSRLNKMTGGQLIMTDYQTPYADINKLGTQVSVEESIFGHRVQLALLYVSYTIASDDHNCIHYVSLYDSLVSLISEMESGQTLCLPVIGNPESFNQVLDVIVSESDDLPDISVLVSRT